MPLSFKPFNILIADSKPKFTAQYENALKNVGYAVEMCPTGEFPTESTSNQRIDVVLLDAHFNDKNLPETLSDFKTHLPDALIILIAENKNLNQAIQATRQGAYTFLEKPFTEEKLLVELENATKRMQLERETRRLKEMVADEHKILGVSPAIEKMRKEIEKAAPTDARVLITGENGSGKELVAEAIHQNSRRADRPFLKINCAAIPKTLIESELFGYEKGAFTGAYQRKTGLIEEADGGTLLLDEIGDLSLETQAKLLRVLQEYEFVRVGGTQPIAFDVRVISATNKNLRKAIKEGQFRSDLFFRLNVIPISVPPLRERLEDIELLAKHFLEKNGRAKGEQKKLTKDAIELLISYRWPGNVRELRNAMERAAIMIEKDEVTAVDLKNIMPDLANAPSGKGQFSLLDGKSLREKIDDYEKHILTEAYKHSKGNISRMARLLKTDRANLHRKLARYGIR